MVHLHGVSPIVGQGAQPPNAWDDLFGAAWTFVDAWGGVLLAVSLLTFLVTLVLLPVLIIRIPADYFAAPEVPDYWRHRHPVIRILVLAGKNLLGLVLLVAGLVMVIPFVPGQGLLSILAGLWLLNFPGKRRLERWLIARRPVYRAVNALRRRAHRAPLELPQDDPPDDCRAG
jgi:hypothetical protein